jgi:hypothetical protein
MTFREVVLAINGLRDRDIMIQAMYRRMTAIIASTNMGGSKVASKINKLWPLPTDTGGDNISEKAKEVLRSFKVAEAAKKISNVERPNNTSSS